MIIEVDNLSKMNRNKKGTIETEIIINVNMKVKAFTNMKTERIIIYL